MPNSSGPRSGTREKLSNDPRERGTSPPQQSIESFEEGQSVHLQIDPSVQKGRYHPRFDGLTGVVVGKQGDSFKVEVSDGNSEKVLIAASEHLTIQDDE